MDLKKKFEELYSIMSESKDVKNMRLFGSVMKDMMNSLIEKDAAEAQKYLDKLEAIKWKNYLTKGEAEKIVSAMNPKAPWSLQEWSEAMTAFGKQIDDEPFFNKYALYTEMNKVYSDHAETIAGAMDSLLENADKSKMLKVVYLMAIDNLTDVDGKYNIRKYFLE